MGYTTEQLVKDISIELSNIRVANKACSFKVVKASLDQIRRRIKDYLSQT